MAAVSRRGGGGLNALYKSGPAATADVAFAIQFWSAVDSATGILEADDLVVCSGAQEQVVRQMLLAPEANLGAPGGLLGAFRV